MYEEDYHEEQQGNTMVSLFDVIKLLHGVMPVLNNNEYEEHFISDHEFNKHYTDLPMEP